MNEQILYKILLTIVKQLSYTDDKEQAYNIRQLKTFAVIQDIEDLKSENLDSLQLNYKRAKEKETTLC